MTSQGQRNGDEVASGQRHLAAVAFVDIVGYTILMSQDEAGTHARWMAIMRQIIEPLAALHRGSIIKSTGDGVLAEFSSPNEAVAWAQKVQRLVGQENRAAPPDAPAIALRISLHVGDLFATRNDIYGEGVNLAARLQDVAEPGGVVMSEAVHTLVRGSLAKPARYLGLIALKNYPVPVPAYAIDPEVHNLAIPVGPDRGPVPSIAVLPLQSLSDNHDDDYFADGIVEDIIVSLANLSEVQAIARGSTLQVGRRGVDPREAGRALAARYVLTGTVRRSARHVRVSVQLNDAESAGTLWALNTEVAQGELFDVQDDIVQRIVGGIAPHVRNAELRRALRKRPESFTAYDLTLRALDLMGRLERDGYMRAREYLTQAMAQDPQFAMPVAWAARWHSLMVGQGWSDPQRETTAAADLAARALQLDPQNALALATAGHLRSFLLRDCDTALIYFERALARSPSSALAWLLSSLTLSYLGRSAQAIRHAERAMVLSPCDHLQFYQYTALGIARYGNGDYEEALRWARMAESTNPQFTATPKLLVAVLSALGRRDEARAAAAQLIALEPGFSLARYVSRQPIQDHALKARYIAHLEAGGLPP
jgi:adenylate cyclase